jgi:hypothetical protein
MTPVEAARLILDQIAEGKFWVSPHPEMMAESAGRRAAHLAALAIPELAPQAYQLLGN